MEGFKTVKMESNREAIQDIDWNAIVRNSFMFSQGLYAELQAPITRWLAMGPLYDEYVSHKTRALVKERIGNYTRAVTEKSDHAATTAEGKLITSPTSEADRVLDNFQYELDQAFTFSDEDRVRQKEIALNRIAQGLINRDQTYLLEREGRPVGEDSRRDKWSSFIIDFGLLHKGDGLFTWNATAKPFKELWDEVLPVIRARYSDEMRTIVDKYIEMHPNLSETEKRQIKSI
jgi:hypothetical protein